MRPHTLKSILLPLVFLSTLNSQLSTLFAQGTAFTYSGWLNDGANPANGTYNLRFALFDALTVGNQVGSPLTNSPVSVSNGLFAVTLDFGNQFPGANRWLEIGVRTNGSGGFITLSPRQALTASPYAITAGNVTGGLPAAQLSGTLPDARLSANVALLAGSQTFTGAKTFSSEVAATSGVRINNTNIWLKGDNNHGLGWYGSGRPFAGSSVIDGPVLFGFSGGALATEQLGTERIALLWNSAGNVGIGTTTPGAPLEVQVAAGQSLQFRQDSGLVPGLNVKTTGGNAGTMRLRNAVEVWPSDDATRAGKVDVRNTAGNATISLDGQTGNIVAHNLPGVEFDVPTDPLDFGTFFFVSAGQTATIKTITVDAPAGGFLVVLGSVFAGDIQGGSISTLARLELFDESANVTFGTASFDPGFAVIRTIHGVLPVPAGARTLSLKIKASNGDPGDRAYYSSNSGTFIAMYFPVRY